MTWARTKLLLLTVLSTVGCTCEQQESVESTAVAPPSESPSRTPSAAPSQAPSVPPLTVLQGSVLAHTSSGQLFIADEDRAALVVVTLPLSSARHVSLPLPGRPAQVAVSEEFVWVTVRQPSLLWIGKRNLDPGAVIPVQEVARVALPADAWGLSISRTHTQALVTSAWAARVSLVDLETRSVRWSLDVAREPRSIAWSQNGRWAFITHLVGAELTRVLLAESPVVERVVLPPAPLRSPGRVLSASLGYSGVLSPREDRFYAARHALGALGKNAWFGAMTVDVLRVQELEPLSPLRPRIRVEASSQLAAQLLSGKDVAVPGSSLTPVTQPRAMLYRRSTRSLLVAGEGDDRIAEFDALALDPTLAVMAQYQVGEDYHPDVHVAGRCAAPAGMALSGDESRLWVYCRATNDIAEVELNTYPRAAAPSSGGETHAAGAEEGAGSPAAPATGSAVLATATPPRVPVQVVARLQLDEDPLGPGGATGRKLFYNATDHVVSGGLGCAGCHPEGRDDGHTWHEAQFTTEDGDGTNFTAGQENIPPEAHTQGVARRTPMLAGRVYAEGPYGWHAESPNIVDRERLGFGLHRWGAASEAAPALITMRANALFDFLRRGLVPPEPEVASLNALQKRGQEIFSRKELKCVECHDPKSGYTTRRAFPLPARPPPKGFDQDPNPAFKIPALTFLKRRAPYFHDGSAASLVQLIEENGQRMGDTSTLHSDEKVALVAFLETL